MTETRHKYTVTVSPPIGISVSLEPLYTLWLKKKKAFRGDAHPPTHSSMFFSISTHVLVGCLHNDPFYSDSNDKVLHQTHCALGVVLDLMITITLTLCNLQEERISISISS